MAKKITDMPSDDANEIYEYLPHPLADMYPLIEGEEFETLARDIEANGLIEPITLFDGKILDGRNRYNACLKARPDGKPFKFGKYDFRNLPADKEPLEFVISKNSHRRHLTQDQKRELITKLLVQRPNASSRAIASIARVSHHTVEDVRQKLAPPADQASTEKPTGQSAQSDCAGEVRITVRGSGIPPEVFDQKPEEQRVGLDGRTRGAGNGSKRNGASSKKPLKAIMDKLPSITDTASQKQIFDKLLSQVGKTQIMEWLLVADRKEAEQPQPEAPAVH
jgi:hypothetical protein